MTTPVHHPPPTLFRRVGSLWYFVVTIGSAGLFAAIPFVHAATRLRRRSVWVQVAVYGVLDAALFGFAAAQGDEDYAGDPLDTVLGLAAIVLIVTACVQLRPLRRAAYGLPPVPRPGIEPEPAVDPAVAQVLAARARRAAARKLAEQDPLMARELGIGRPDLGRGYDDGGLVDLGSAPTATIADVCELAEPEAARVVAAQGTFFSVDELLVVADLPLAAWDRIRERGVVVRS